MPARRAEHSACPHQGVIPGRGGEKNNRIECARCCDLIVIQCHNKHAQNTPTEVTARGCSAHLQLLRPDAALTRVVEPSEKGGSGRPGHEHDERDAEGGHGLAARLARLAQADLASLDKGLEARLAASEATGGSSCISEHGISEHGS